MTIAAQRVLHDRVLLEQRTQAAGDGRMQTTP